MVLESLKGHVWHQEFVPRFPAFFFSVNPRMSSTSQWRGQLSCLAWDFRLVALKALGVPIVSGKWGEWPGVMQYIESVEWGTNEKQINKSSHMPARNFFFFGPNQILLCEVLLGFLGRTGIDIFNVGYSHHQLSKKSISFLIGMGWRNHSRSYFPNTMRTVLPGISFFFFNSFYRAISFSLLPIWR